MKITLSEIKKNLQGANSGEEEAENQINHLEHKKEKSIQPEQQEEKIIQKNEDRIRSLWDISKHTNIRIIGVPEGREEEQEIGKLFEKIMKGNFPKYGKGNRHTISPGSTESPKQVGLKEDHINTHHN